MVRLKAIQLKLGYATPQALWRDAAPGGAPGDESGGAGEEAERGGSEEEERPSALAHAARRLVAVGFARGDAEMSLRACGAAGSTHDALGTAVLLRALTLLIELQLGLVPRARDAHGLHRDQGRGGGGSNSDGGGGGERRGRRGAERGRSGGRQR